MDPRRRRILDAALAVCEERGVHAARMEEVAALAQVSKGTLYRFFESKEEEIPFAQRRDSDEFTYGYALTVHKAQGSQWDDVVLFDESFAFREHRSRWLYTALTRAAERITIVR